MLGNMFLLLNTLAMALYYLRLASSPPLVNVTQLKAVPHAHSDSLGSQQGLLFMGIIPRITPARRLFAFRLRRCIA